MSTPSSTPNLADLTPRQLEAYAAVADHWAGNCRPPSREYISSRMAPGKDGRPLSGTRVGVILTALERRGVIENPPPEKPSDLHKSRVYPSISLDATVLRTEAAKAREMYAIKASAAAAGKAARPAKRSWGSKAAGRTF